MGIYVFQISFRKPIKKKSVKNISDKYSLWSSDQYFTLDDLKTEEIKPELKKQSMLSLYFKYQNRAKYYKYVNFLF